MKRFWRSGSCSPGTRASRLASTSGAVCEAGEIEAQIVNLSSDGFRIHTANPLQVGWVVTLEAARQFPVKALICWACDLEAGGIFSEPVAL